MTIMNRVQNHSLSVEPNSLELLLDERKAARVLGVSLSYLRKSRCEGTVGKRTPAPPFVYVGNRVYYRPDE
ncbi:MAG: hypothetical protein LBT23_11665, partial [Synergistaceae bacterium]|nr:hypothetical protein [Synergistaceae bacterium]